MPITNDFMEKQATLSLNQPKYSPYQCCPIVLEQSLWGFPTRSDTIQAVWLEASNLGFRNNTRDCTICWAKTGTEQLLDYRPADLRLCFSICKKQGSTECGSFKFFRLLFKQHALCLKSANLSLHFVLYIREKNILQIVNSPIIQKKDTTKGITYGFMGTY